jgi:hypothetical protein
MIRVGLVATESHDLCCCHRIYSIGLIPVVEYQRGILDSVVDGMYHGNGDGTAALDATVDD